MCSAKSCRSNLIEKCTGLVIDETHHHKNIVLTNEKLEEIQMGLQMSPWKSVRQLSQKTGVSVGSASNAAELMKFFHIDRVMHERNLQMLHRG
jgi:hypothetical protein